MDSNDKLYGADKKFIEEILKIVDTLTKEVLEAVKTFGEKVSSFFVHFSTTMVVISKRYNWVNCMS